MKIISRVLRNPSQHIRSKLNLLKFCTDGHLDRHYMSARQSRNVEVPQRIEERDARSSPLTGFVELDKENVLKILTFLLDFQGVE